LQLKNLIRRRLNVSLKRNVSRQGIALSAGCEQRLQALIGNALDRMQGQQVLDREDKAFLAEQSIQRLVARLVSESARTGTFPLVEEQALDSALQHTCPLWPFC
jgi:hypothetical protein